MAASTSNATSNALIIQADSGASVKSIENGKGAKTNVIEAKAGESYRVVTQKGGKQQRLDNVIATKVGDDLHLEYADGSRVIIEDYFIVCENAECSVSVAGEDAAGYQITAEAEGLPLADGTNMLYAHGDGEALIAMAEGRSAMLDAFSAHYGDAVTAEEAWLPSERIGSLAKALCGWGALGAAGFAAYKLLEDDATAADAAIAFITAYADDNTQPAPTVQDYLDAGVTGVDADNLAAVNAGVDAVAGDDVDTVAEIQGLVTDADAALATIEAYNNGNGVMPAALTAQNYADAGITGVDADNLAAVNAQVLAALP